MRIDRLKLDIGAEQFDLTLHPRLTFLTGVEQGNREQVGREILIALQEGRPGLNLDLIGRDGRLIEVYRPTQGATTVRDAVSGADLTDRFLIGEKVNLLASRCGGSPGDQPTDFEMLHIRPAKDIATPRHATQAAESPDAETSLATAQYLAQLNQDTLWATALVLAETEVEVESLASNVAGQERASQRRATVESCHAAVELAGEILESDRSLLLSMSATLALLATISAVAIHPFLAMAFVLASIGAGSISGWRWRQLVLASRAESDALAAAGIRSYVSVQRQHADAEDNKATLGPALELLEEIHEAATQAWTDLVGPGVSLAWAVESRPQIDQLANSRVRKPGGRSRPRTASLGTQPAPTTIGHSWSERTNGPRAQVPIAQEQDEEPQSPLVWLHQQLCAIEKTFSEPVPVVIDHPLTSFATTAIGSAPAADAQQEGSLLQAGPANLALIADVLDLHSTQLQLIVMTDNQGVLEWFSDVPDRAQTLHLGDRNSHNFH